MDWTIWIAFLTLAAAASAQGQAPDCSASIRLLGHAPQGGKLTATFEGAPPAAVQVKGTTDTARASAAAAGSRAAATPR